MHKMILTGPVQQLVDAAPQVQQNAATQVCQGPET